MRKSDGIWEGDTSAVARARSLYETDPKGRLIDFAVALYSFRHHRRFAEELMALRPLLAAEAERTLNLLNVGAKGGRAIELANRADVLATHLAWISGREEGAQRHDHLPLVIQLCDKGLEHVTGLRRGHHTPSLLRLTKASAMYEEGMSLSAHSLLEEVERDVRWVADRRQRARIMRKLGVLHRQHGKLWRGLLWGWRAVTITGVPMAVRVKSVAALLGVDR